MSRARLFDRIDAGAALAELAGKRVNFVERELGSAGWHHDNSRTALSAERPGPPEPDGAWRRARALVAAYEFSDPAVIRAVYRAGADLNGRDMLLEGRFAILRFYMGVRITQVIDERRACTRSADPCAHGDWAWGWAYETLDGHLERGRMAYTVVKHHDTGEVELAIHALSQPASTMGPITRVGWTLFGRRTQLRFYRSCGTRLRNAVHDGRGRAGVPTDGLVLAPSDARHRWFDRLAIRRHQPG